MATRKPIGQLLLEKGLVEKEQIQRALEYQQKSGEKLRLGEILVRFGYVTATDVLKCVGEQFDVRVVDLNKVRPEVEAVDAVPRNTARMHGILPLKKTGNAIVVAMDDLDLCAIDNLKFILNMDVKPVLAAADDIKDAIERFYGGEESTMDNMLREFTEGEAVAENGTTQMIGDEGDDAPLVRLVFLIVSDAVQARASDIHVEPMTNRLRVRYRIDGVCQEVESPPKRLQNSIIARLKLMAGMDLAEKRKPQDGRIPLVINGQSLDLRVSDIPTTDGESIVMRILSKEAARVSLVELGFHPSDLEHFERIIRRPNGIFLVTGPTGSGKTTTLYSALNELNRPDTKIITAEDPIEYTFPGINQSQVQTDINRTFPVILRAMLRQAPEIILVGEIRDEETAEIAVRAALTGHLVFSTLHTNDAPSAIPRLIDMGIKPYMVASSVQAIMAQRLIRTICTNCKEPYEYPERQLRAVGLDPESVEGITLYRGAGCNRCNGSGYHGRLGIFELMEMNADLRNLTFAKAATGEIREKARSFGMLTLMEDGLRKVIQGVTTIDEILRVAGGVE
ncbi:MAG: Flp pilus assembly complex ATPase component TadA [Candidatus Brocadiaceae bacterium]|nr:Flp pilus assembly complex ATPase component TadA [Candidatus Brocadiaceae bacterium]